MHIVCPYELSNKNLDYVYHIILLAICLAYIRKFASYVVCYMFNFIYTNLYWYAILKKTRLKWYDACYLDNVLKLSYLNGKFYFLVFSYNC